jgi:hypothetical protein
VVVVISGVGVGVVVVISGVERDFVTVMCTGTRRTVSPTPGVLGLQSAGGKFHDITKQCEHSIIYPYSKINVALPGLVALKRYRIEPLHSSLLLSRLMNSFPMACETSSRSTSIPQARLIHVETYSDPLRVRVAEQLPSEQFFSTFEVQLKDSVRRSLHKSVSMAQVRFSAKRRAMMLTGKIATPTLVLGLDGFISNTTGGSFEADTPEQSAPAQNKIAAMVTVKCMEDEEVQNIVIQVGRGLSRAGEKIFDFFI